MDANAAKLLTLATTCRTGAVCVYEGQDLHFEVSIENPQDYPIGFPLELVQATGPIVRLFDGKREQFLRRNPGDVALRHKWTRIAPKSSVSLRWLIHSDEIEGFGGTRPSFEVEVIFKGDIEAQGKVFEHNASTVMKIGASEAAAPETTGPWSRATRGLRARLVAQDKWTIDGTTTLGVYLELHNVSDVGTPMELAWSDRALTFSLVDAQQRPVEESHLPRGGPQAVLSRLVIPHDGHLRFRVSVTGVAVAKNQRWLIALPNQDWAIPRDARTTYDLGAKLSVPRKAGTSHDWYGDLVIPPVSLRP
jgi:hypothetical protein